MILYFGTEGYKAYEKLIKEYTKDMIKDICEKCGKPTCSGNCKPKKPKLRKKNPKKKLKWTPNGVQYND